MLKKGSSSFARIQTGKLTGLININFISKPTSRAGSRSRSSEVGDVLGGAQSQEFQPGKLGLDGKSWTSVRALVNDVAIGINARYGEPEYREIRRYLQELIKSICGHHMNLAEAKVQREVATFKIRNKYNITKGDMRIISKWFGEVAGAINVLNTGDYVLLTMPSGNQPLYDFIAEKKDGSVHYFSAKSAGGSSTSLGNLKFIMSTYSSKNPKLAGLKRSGAMDMLDRLMNAKDKGYTTTFNILAFFNDEFSSKVRQIITILDGLHPYPTNGLEDLDEWFLSLKAEGSKVTEQGFIDTINKVYDTVLSDFGKPSRATVSSLSKMFKNKGGNTFDGGYLYYPMGQYIMQWGNNTPMMIDALNTIANWKNNIYQSTADLDLSGAKISVLGFAENTFRFSYNAMAMKPNNRPLGFKEI
jgi:hypothetical protein